MIDVAEQDRISALTTLPGTFAFRADAAENLDGLVPDIGLTGMYPYRSVYRPQSFANAGLPATLQHRFWDTLCGDGIGDHTGQRYIGLVMYDEHAHDCRVEVTLGADAVGCIVPFRHDNRRHLYCLDYPVDFKGGMEVLRITGTGDASYRIENVVLLKERPEPTCYRPRIDRLTAFLRRGPDGSFAVDVDATTWPAARCSVTVTRADTDELVREAHEEDALSLHSISVSGLPAPTAPGYRACIRATEAEGLVETAEIAVTGESGATVGPVTVPVEVCSFADAEMDDLPLTFGVPVPRGQVMGAAGGRWEVQGVATPVQCRPHGFWPDGSASWMLVDGCLPRALAPAARQAGTVTLDTSSAGSRPADGLRCTSTDGVVTVSGGSLRVSAEAGSAEPLPVIETRSGDGPWCAAHAGSATILTLGGGVELRQGPIQDLSLEEEGWQRAVIRYQFGHLDDDGIVHFVSTIRVHVYRGLQAVRIVHRLQVTSPHLPPAVRGTADDIPTEADTVRQAIAGTDGEQATLLTVRGVSLVIRRAGNQSVQWPDGPVAGSPVSQDGAVRLIHDHDQGYRIEQGGAPREVAGRVPGHVTVCGVADADAGDSSADTITVALRRFWQTYPRAIQVTGDEIAMELLPSPSGAARPADEESWHRIYFWLRDDGYLLKAGMALTSEMLLACGPRDEALLAWFEQPPAVRPSLEWLNACGVIGPLASKDTGVLDDYERAVDSGYERWISDRDISREYGWVNFGDWYGESNWSWGNNEYDPPFAHYIEFLRGGDPRWFILGAEAARHLTDVDTVNSSADADQVGAQYTHMPGHAGGYLPPYFRSKMSGSSNFPSHTWVEGSVLHYLLTGDENLRESLDRTAGWLLSAGLRDFAGGIQHYDFGNCRECGWHLIHLTALARMSASNLYLNAATLIVDRVLERQEPGGGWERVLKEGHCGCELPRERGEAGFMVGVLLSGLRRYHELTGDEQVGKAIEGGVRWLIRRTYDADSGHFRYTPCLYRGGGPQPLYTRQVIEGIAYAHALNGDAELREMVERGLRDLRDLRNLPEASPEASPGTAASGFGKDWTSLTRYVPSLLAYYLARTTN